MVGTRRAVFLDRDGVIVIPEFRDGRSFAPRSIEDFRIYPEAAAALEDLRAAGFALVVVTNQPDVGCGLISADALEAMHAELNSALPIDRIEVCTHGRDEGCQCRKPAPAMLQSAAAAMGLDLRASFMVGDRASDVEAGKRAGCRTIFIDQSYEQESAPSDPDFVCGGLGAAAGWILSR